MIAAAAEQLDFLAVQEPMEPVALTRLRDTLEQRTGVACQQLISDVRSGAASARSTTAFSGALTRSQFRRVGRPDTKARRVLWLAYLTGHGLLSA